MKVLLTGGAGFIGSAACRRMIRQGWPVLVLDKLTYAGHRSSLESVSELPNFTFVQGDICDRAAVDSLVLSFEPDAILHLAAESHVDRSITASADFITTNVVGTFTLLEAARAYRGSARDGFRFLHVSTDEIFGSLESGAAFTEKTQIDPRSPYSASKAAAAHLASAWHHTYGLPVLISNCSNNYGPHQLPEKLIPLSIIAAIEERPIPLYGDGLNIRDWLFVEDHVDALLMLLEHGQPGSYFNIGGRNERSNRAVVEAICDLVDRHSGPRHRRRLITRVEDRPGHDRRYAIDPSRIEASLGWRAKTAFEEGLEKTVLWYLEHESWWRPLCEQGHGRKRLGLPNREDVQ